MKRLRVYDSLDDISRASAGFILKRIHKAIEEKGNATVFLNGGSTPKSCFQYLGHFLHKRQNLLDKTQWFIGDERWVTSAESESNEYQARENLFKNLPEKKIHLHSWNALEDSPLRCAQDYDDLLFQQFTVKNQTPDIVMLGMGDDGHTASLFPGSRALFPDQNLKNINPYLGFNTAAIFIKEKNTWRLSLTPQFINKAKDVIFMISGENKKTPFLELLKGNREIPSTWIMAQETYYFVTQEVQPDNLEDFVKEDVLDIPVSHSTE